MQPRKSDRPGSLIVAARVWDELIAAGKQLAEMVEGGIPEEDDALWRWREALRMAGED